MEFVAAGLREGDEFGREGEEVVGLGEGEDLELVEGL
jgi:hypothetical protein